jgi:acyl-CoA thioesterase FadM
MARTKIILPRQFFDVPIKIPVRITDINYGDHVGNDSLVAIIHEARVQFLQHHGFSEFNIDGVSVIMSDLIVEFKKESFYKDIIEVKMGRGDISRVSFELFYQLNTRRQNELITIANAKTTMVCFDYVLKKAIGVPEKLKNILT